MDLFKTDLLRTTQALASVGSDLEVNFSQIGQKDLSMAIRGKVVFVDDDQQVLDGLRMQLRKFESIEHAEYFTDAELALAYVKEHGADVVVSDEVMPGMHGTTLLSLVKEFNPGISLVLLTGLAPIAAVNRAIHEIGVYVFLEKPAKPERLREVITLAVRHAKSSAGVKI